MSKFRPINRDTGFLLPHSVDEWLPQRHPARFIVEMIDGLDLSELVKEYRGSGSASYHSAMLLGLLVYGYQFMIRQQRLSSFGKMRIRSRPAGASPACLEAKGECGGTPSIRGNHRHFGGPPNGAHSFSFRIF